MSSSTASDTCGGCPQTSIYDHDVIAGRWFSQAEADDAARVVVVGEALANQTGLAVGDGVTVETRRGPIDLDVIGIDGQLVNNGQGHVHAVPDGARLRRVDHRQLLGENGRPDTRPPSTPPLLGSSRCWSATATTWRRACRYIDRDQNMAENRLIVTVVMAMGLPVVAIGMIGLVNAMASNVLDRTREIGILRSIGARRRDLRAMFRAEGLTIAFLGWLLGIPVGYGLARFILWVFAAQVRRHVHVPLPALADRGLARRHADRDADRDPGSPSPHRTTASWNRPSLRVSTEPSGHRGQFPHPGDAGRRRVAATRTLINEGDRREPSFVRPQGESGFSTKFPPLPSPGRQRSS